MVDRSIGYRLSFYVSVAVILVFIAFIIAYFLFNQRLLKENIESRAIGLSVEVNAAVTNEVLSTKELTVHASEQILYYYRNGDVELLLKQMISKHPFLISAELYLDSATNNAHHYHTVRRNGSQLEYRSSVLPAFINKSEKDNFTELSRSEFLGWSVPFQMESSGEVVASYFHPIPQEPESSASISGYLRSNLSLSALNDSLNRISIGQDGYAFVIDTSGNYLTHPDENRILKTNFFSVSSKLLTRNQVDVRKLFREQVRGSAVAYPSALNYKKSWVYFSPVPQTGWYLVFVMPYAELYRELYGVTLRMALFALTGMVLIYFLVSYITRKQMEPLSNVTSRLTSFSSPFKLNTQNEVKQVANSLEYLKLWFEQYQISREKEELTNTKHSRDLQQASEIQQSLIKNNFPAFPDHREIDLHAIYKPAQVVSGDLFDFFFIDDNHLLFTIGDVSGKGIPAAIFMSVCQTVIKNNSRYMQPRTIVEKTNFELSRSNNHQYFLTLFLGIMDVRSGELTYCNAAHTFPFVLKPDGSSTELQSTHGLPLGLYPDKQYDDEQVVLESGDTVILYTDGVFDALNEKNIVSGSQWFQKKLNKMNNLSPKEVTSLLEDEISKTNNPSKDDICLLAIKYQP